MNASDRGATHVRSCKRLGGALLAVLAFAAKAANGPAAPAADHVPRPTTIAPMTIDVMGAPCVQTVDVVRAGRLRPGVVDYRVSARIGSSVNGK